MNWRELNQSLSDMSEVEVLTLMNEEKRGACRITILRRLARGEKIWQAHRQHFYQRAVAGGASHARVSVMIASANVGLVVLALLSATSAFGSLVGAALITALLLAAMQRRAAAP